VILHIPHSSRTIPDDLRESLALSDRELEAELIRITDSFTDELFPVEGDDIHRIVFPVSRLVLDPERFVDDEKEPMAARGMGVVYEKTSRLQTLRRPVSAAEKEALLDRFYRPHHEYFTKLVNRALDVDGCCLIIDCHSFPSKPMPFEIDQARERPDICLGIDAFHTPDRLTASAEELFQSHGYSVEINSPYAGSIVPHDHYHADRRVMSIMIEVKRGLYMDEKTGRKNHGFKNVKKNISRIVQNLNSSFSQNRG